MVYAADLYKSGFAKDPLSSAAGRRYRYLVLQPGSSQSEAETLENFLGRKPSSEAYFDAVPRDWEF
jgi:metallopeptidase MepB